MRRAIAPIAVALAYLALALFCLRAAARAPWSLLPYPAEVERHGVVLLDRADQAFTVRALADNANRLVAAPTTLFSTGQCFPLAHPQTLGEHLLGESILAAIPFALTRDPIATFNAVALLSLLVPALAMYALAREWTGNASAAFVAGLLFAFHPGRLVTVSKPFLAGNGWTPLVLLFLHRLILRRRWRDAALLAVASALQLLASFYQVLGAALLVGAYGVALGASAFRARRRAVPPDVPPDIPPDLAPDPAPRARLLPKLVVVGVVLAAIAWVLFSPYLEARAAWGVLRGRTPIFFYLRHFFAPLGPAFPGVVAIVLAIVGLADRLRGARPRRGEDPRWPILLAGLFVVWCLSTGVPIPGLGIVLPSPLQALSGIVPGLDAVRVLPLARFAWTLAVAALAAFGAAAILDAASQRLPATAWATRAALAAALAVVALAELLWPPLARRSFLEEPIVHAYDARPGADEIALYRSVPAGAVLDLPLSSREARGALAAVPALRAAAWHLRPIAACYNSFVTPLARDVEERAALLDGPAAPAALDALAALGFGSVLVHEGDLSPEARQRLVAALAASGRAARIAAAPGLALYALEGRAPVVDTFQALGPARDARPGAAGATNGAERVSAGEVVEVGRDAGARAVVPFVFRNDSGRTYRHPAPIEPRALRASWRASGGEVAFAGRARGFLPLALAPGESVARDVEVELPASPGDYVVELSIESEPARAISAAMVRVR